jgi:predicted acyl esterase
VADPLLSQPKYELKVDPGVKIGMRDGVKLSTDLYLPQTEGKVPVILIRTPYKKEMVEVQGRYYARRGYAVAVQDCRGRFGSFPTFSRNLNTGGHNETETKFAAAKQVVYHERAHPSHVLLPVIPAGELKR